MADADRDGLRADIATMLADEKCQTFVEKLIKKVYEQHPHLKSNGLDLLGTFDTVRSHGGFFWVDSSPGNSLSKMPGADGIRGS